MNHNNRFTRPIPFSRPDALEIIAENRHMADINGVFLTFVMIPVEERLGEWRFAGVCPSLVQALHQLSLFASEVGLTTVDEEIPLQQWVRNEALEIVTNPAESWSFSGLPQHEIGPHQTILLGEGQAPYDDFAFCILEIESLDGHPFANRFPETHQPEEWSE
ncbi:MAG: hypothetical protein K1Y36_21080 [Blastocatellia bacterium]|nr:hypothetical protein [Blastocatellia bacterium]